MKKFVFLVGLAVFILAISGCLKPTYIYPDFNGDEKMWDHILDIDEPFDFDEVPLGVIMPHHLVAGDVIAQMYAGIDEVTEPPVVFVIGPNHYDNGEADIQTCKKCVYRTTEGDLEVDDDFVKSLVSDGVAEYQDDSFVQEHSIHSHATYIKHYFPDAKIVPIILKWKASYASLNELIKWMNENIPDDALVVASVDFSHYAPKEIADFHDTASKASILNFDYNNLFDLEIDSPGSLYTLLSFLSEQGYLNGLQYAHTNLQDYMTNHTEETTSHQFFAFFEGEGEADKSASILSVGNLPEDSTLNFMDSWQWDSSYDQTTDNTITKQLRDIRGKEDRYLQGADYLVFDLDDNVCRTETQNEIKVSFCKFVEGSYEDKKFDEVIERVNDEADVVYLMYEWDGGEWNSSREKFAKSLADEVDIFVGRGLKEVVPMQIQKGSLLFYNLGDFVVDNKLLTDLNSDSEGVMVGVNITEDKYEVFVFPVDVKNGYPVLKDFSERPKAFAEYISDVDFGYNDDVDDVYATMLIER